MDRKPWFAAAVVFRTAQLLWLLPGVIPLLLFNAPIVTSQTRLVSDTASLYAAFGDETVTHIQLANSITISNSKGMESFPILLRRDCLIDGAPGSSYPRLDFNFATNDRVQLGPGVTLTFRGLVLANVISRSQLSLDFFAQSPASSSIVWESTVDRRKICQPLQDIRNAWNKAPRPDDAGGPSQPQHQEILDGPNCNGDKGCYSTAVLWTIDAVVHSPAGYRLRLNDTLTVCEEFISAACIENLGSDLCYLNSIEELLSGHSSSNTPTSGSSKKGLSSGAQAGIIAGCIVGVILLLLVILLLCCWRRRRPTDVELATAAASGAGDGRGSGDAQYNFSNILDNNSEAGLQAFGSTRSVDTAAANAVQDQQQNQAKLPSGTAAILRSGGAAAVAAAEARPSEDSIAGPALVTALESTGSPCPAGSVLSAGLRPSGSGTRDLPYSSSFNHPGLPCHSHLSHITAQSTQRPHQVGLHPAAGFGSTHAHSFGSAVISALRSMLSRAGSLTHGHSSSRPPLVSASGTLGSVSSSAAAAAAATAPGPVASRGPGASASGGSSVPRGGGKLAATTPPKSGVLGSGRDSSGGQLALASYSSRPSISEIQQDLERMEEHWRRDGRNGGGRVQSSTPSRQRSPRRRRQGGGGGSGGGGDNGSGGGGGGGQSSDPPGPSHDPVPSPGSGHGRNRGRERAK
ncbi:hypothetical protein Vretimale_1268 [Volvox reticuliferus]|uniref:Uncharacterized protein n=1 Tax=Volvox reticuliferus TaxID=1737510 RepID=A0A8J4FQD5_9CHLO|nr:hypothetical protein Vretifemale_10702 [Volvox reticuliferus]GIL95238.1 hypothetical protein Vretimale_1268 [Volvox reticuliferus]